MSNATTPNVCADAKYPASCKGFLEQCNRLKTQPEPKWVLIDQNNAEYPVDGYQDCLDSAPIYSSLGKIPKKNISKEGVVPVVKGNTALPENITNCFRNCGSDAYNNGEQGVQEIKCGDAGAWQTIYHLEHGAATCWGKPTEAGRLVVLLNSSFAAGFTDQKNLEKLSFQPLGKPKGLISLSKGRTGESEDLFDAYVEGNKGEDDVALAVLPSCLLGSKGIILSRFRKDTVKDVQVAISDLNGDAMDDIVVKTTGVQEDISYSVYLNQSFISTECISYNPFGSFNMSF